MARRVVAGDGHQCQRAVLEGEHGCGRGDVAGRGEHRVAPVRSRRVDLDHLLAGHPPGGVEVVDAAVTEDPAGDGDVGRGRRGRVQRGRADGVQLAARDGGPSGGEAGVEPARVPDLDRYPGRGDPATDGDPLTDRASHGLLAQHRHPGVGRRDDQLGVRVGGGGDDDTVDPGGEQLLRRVGGLDAEALGDGLRACW